MRGSLSALSVLVLAAAGLYAGVAEARVDVVSTIPDFGDIAKSIGGDLVEVKSLVRPTQDPHFLDAKPSYLVALSSADVLLVAGMELEAGWLPPLLVNSRNGKIQRGNAGYLDCSTLVVPMEVETADRSKGDIHQGGNPHYWYDPRNGLRLAAGIAEKLAEVDPSNAAAYRRGAAAFQAELQRKIGELRMALAPFKGTKVVVYHRSFVYFLDFAGLVEAGALEPKPGIPPGSVHVASLIASARQRGVKLVLQESFYPSSLSKIFAQKTGATLVVVPTMTGAGGTKSYIEVVDALVRAVTMKGEMR